MQIYSYEDAAFIGSRKRAADITEVYRGADMVRWWGEQERVLQAKIDEYAQKEGKEGEIASLKVLLDIWRQNRIDGSMRISTLNALYSATAQGAAATGLDTANFIGRLRDNIAQVIATKQELPTVPSSTGKTVPGGGLPSGAKHKPVMPTGNFAAQANPPGQTGLNSPPDAAAAAAPAKPDDDKG